MNGSKLQYSTYLNTSISFDNIGYDYFILMKKTFTLNSIHFTTCVLIFNAAEFFLTDALI